MRELVFLLFTCTGFVRLDDLGWDEKRRSIDVDGALCVCLIRSSEDLRSRVPIRQRYALANRREEPSRRRSRVRAHVPLDSTPLRSDPIRFDPIQFDLI